jgi:hypothetical protein
VGIYLTICFLPAFCRAVPSPILAVWLGHIGRLASRLPFELYGPSRDISEDDCCNVSKIMTFVSSTDLSNPT